MQTEIEIIFEAANKKFLEKEVNNILSGVSERNLCGSLMCFIKDELKDTLYKNYYVDVEYNRKQDGKLKTIIAGNFEIINICCDLVVHSRGENLIQDNLIALEMKKSTQPDSEKRKDKIRLKCLTRDSFDGLWSFDGKTFPEHVCRYLFGVYYEINIDKRRINLQYMAHGSLYKQVALDF